PGADRAGTLGTVLGRRSDQIALASVIGWPSPCAKLSAMAVTTGSATAPALERYEAVIGIEVHCQLKTASKMFCGCSNTYADAPPNTHVRPGCFGLPGTLPTINRRAVEHVLATAVAIAGEFPAATRWDRKNYF